MDAFCRPLENLDAIALRWWGWSQFWHANLKVESTAALALGALFAQPERFAGKKVCCIVSGGNVDPEVYSKALQEAI